MIVLGIADGPDSGAALVADGRIVAATSQESLDRTPHSGAFPWSAIDSVLEQAGISARSVERVAVAGAFTPSAAHRAVASLRRAPAPAAPFSTRARAAMVWRAGARATGAFTLEADACRAVLGRILRERPLHRAAITTVDHHRALAQGAYRTQPHESCLVLTAGEAADGTTATAWMGSCGQLDLLWRQGGTGATGDFWRQLAAIAGVDGPDPAAALATLAGAVDPPDALVAHLHQRLRFVAPGFNRWTGRASLDAPFWSEVRRWEPSQVAAAALAVHAAATADFVRYWTSRTGCGQVAVAGAAFVDDGINRRLASLDGIASLWTPPHPAEGGLPLGAALDCTGASPRALPSPFLGPTFGEFALEKALSLADLPRTRPADDIAAVADRLVSGALVARLHGPMEWGRRALGHRSVLALVDAASAPRLRQHLETSEPPALVLRARDARHWLDGETRARDAARLLAVRSAPRAALREIDGAPLWPDGTVRAQVLPARDDPALTALLAEVERRAGRALLLQAPFHGPGEPLVCSPGDAIRTWRATRLHSLWMGPFLVDAPRA